MRIDCLTVAVVFLSFALFLLLHMLDCRRMNEEDLLKSLWRMCVVTMVFPGLLAWFFFILKAADMVWMAWVCVAAVASFLHGLLCFVYVLCVFGPYETSVRMRLVREIFKGQREGITAEQLSCRYNNEIITAIRLRRLTGSKYIIEKDGTYKAGSATNVFFIFDIFVKVLLKAIGRK